MGAHRKPDPRLTAATLRKSGGRHAAPDSCQRRLLQDMRRPARSSYVPRHAKQEETDQ